MTSRTWTLDDLRFRKDEINAIAHRYHAYDVQVFGSVARNEAQSSSDIDFLVDFTPGATIFNQVGLWRTLSEFLGCDVDVIAKDEPTDAFMQNALRDAVPL